MLSSGEALATKKDEAELSIFLMFPKFTGLQEQCESGPARGQGLL